MFKKSSKSLKTFLYIFLSIIILIFFCIGLFLYKIFTTGLCTEYTTVKHYQSALKVVRDTDGITHFPNEIPKNAKDIKFFSFSGAFYHQRIFLAFSIDKNYIDEEVTRLNLLPGIKYEDTKEDIIAFQTLNQAKLEANINPSEYIYYPINNSRNKISYSLKKFPIFSGIGINKNHNGIFYYYNNPEG